MSCANHACWKQLSGHSTVPRKILCSHYSLYTSLATVYGYPITVIFASLYCRSKRVFATGSKTICMLCKNSLTAFDDIRFSLLHMLHTTTGGFRKTAIIKFGENSTSKLQRRATHAGNSWWREADSNRKSSSPLKLYCRRLFAVVFNSQRTDQNSYEHSPLVTNLIKRIFLQSTVNNVNQICIENITGQRFD